MYERHVYNSWIQFFAIVVKVLTTKKRFLVYLFQGHTIPMRCGIFSDFYFASIEHTPKATSSFHTPNPIPIFFILVFYLDLLHLKSYVHTLLTTYLCYITVTSNMRKTHFQIAEKKKTIRASYPFLEL